MPNWCENELIVEGSKEEIKVFKNQAVGKSSTEDDPADLDFFNFFNQKEEVMMDVEWQSSNFGTKWGACNSTITNESDNELSYKFDTAWGPATIFFEQVSNLFPSLTFRLNYIEIGVGFKGDFVIKNGVVIEDSYLEGDDFEEWLKEEDPELDEAMFPVAEM